MATLLQLLKEDKDVLNAEEIIYLKNFEDAGEVL